jgi:HEPN domain-containing protein
MKPPDEVRRELVQKWLDKAEEDLAVANQLLADDVPYFAAIGFHAQQAAEKFIKAFLVSIQLEFPKTHDLRLLIAIVRLRDAALAENLDACNLLSDYGVEARYPGDLPELSEDDAKNAAKLAEQVRSLIVPALWDIPNGQMPPAEDSAG